jgi:phenylalanyl-tRNA synthetase alpha subunit
MRSVATDAVLDRRGVSETVGFVLVFGIVVSTVAVVYAGGFDALTAARDAQQFDNTERAFDVMDSNIEDLAVRGAPSRTTEILLSDGTIRFGDPVTFNVSAGGSNYYTTTIRPVTYQADDGDSIVYVNGAVFRQYGDRAIMFDEPRFVAGNRTLVPYVITRADSNNVSTDNTRRLLVRTRVTDREVRTFTDTTANLTITSPRAPAWQRYFEDELDATCMGGPNQVECLLPGDDVYVQAFVVKVVLG